MSDEFTIYGVVIEDFMRINICWADPPLLSSLVPHLHHVTAGLFIRVQNPVKQLCVQTLHYTDLNWIEWELEFENSLLLLYNCCRRRFWLCLLIGGKFIVRVLVYKCLKKRSDNIDGFVIILIKRACQDRWYVDWSVRDVVVFYKQVNKKTSLKAWIHTKNGFLWEM